MTTTTPAPALRGRVQKYKNFPTVQAAVAAGFDAAQVKYDGFFAEVVVAGGNAVAYSRTGNVIATHPCPDFRGSAVLVGELLIGTARSVGTPQFGRLMVFDCTYHDEYDGHAECVPVAEMDYTCRRTIAAGVVLAFNGWAEMVETHHRGAVESLWDAHVVRDGGEGLVLRKTPREGHGPGYAADTLGRVKAMETHDYVVMGVEEGQGKHVGRLGALVCGQYDACGRLVECCRVGGGFTDEQREGYWNARGRLAGLVMEARGYQYFEATGALRHPQFSRWRGDKPAAECRM
jgi:ATP-dependent DNA ligase